MLTFSKSIIGPVCLLLLLLFSSKGYGNITGSVEVGVRIDDSQDQQEAVVFRQFGSVYYLSDNEETGIGLDYMLQEPDFSDSSIDQLYINQYIGANDSFVKAGRFHRFDNLGYYTLDGMQYSQKLAITRSADKRGRSVDVEAYAGKPLRSDDTHLLTGDYVVGIESQFRWPFASNAQALYEPRMTQMANDVSIRLGYQALKLEEASQRANLGVSAKKASGFIGGFRQELNFSSSLTLEKRDLEDLLVNFRLYPDNQNYTQLLYKYYNPDERRPTFKERFYSIYAIGEMNLAEFSHHYVASDTQRYSFAARSTTRQRGGSGHGAETQASYTPNQDWKFDVSLDYLTLGNTAVSSFYMGLTVIPSAYSRLEFQTALQWEDKELNGFNRAIGLQGSYQYMFNSDLFLTLSAELLANSDRANNVLSRLYLVYYFDRGLI